MKSKLLRQIIKMSRYTVYGFCVQCLCLTMTLAKEGIAQQASVEKIYLTLNIEKNNLEEVFERITSETAFDFIYNNDLLESQSPISINMKNESLGEVLRTVSKKTSLQFKRVDQDILVSQRKPHQPNVVEVLSDATLKKVSIPGKVVDENNESLPGVSVRVKGTTEGTITDFDGNFNIQAQVSDRLVFSFVGMSSVEVEVSEANKKMLSVTLYGDILQLDEMIVTGTSVATSRKQLGNAISTIKSQSIATSGSQDITGALSGKLPGALVNQNSGNPAGGISVTLRGASTVFGNSDPLYVIDGVIVDNSSTELLPLGGYAQNRLVDINPNDIERIEVIKGAAAAAIYGSRASNGVIQIFTKRGANGETQVTFSTSFRVNQLRKQIEENEEPMQFAGPGSSSLVPAERYSMQDCIFRTAFGTNNNITVKGGDENTQFYTSASYSKNGGIIKNTDYERYTLRANIDQTLNDWLSATVNTNYSVSQSHELPNGGINEFFGVLTGFNFNNTNYNPNRQADGSYINTLGFVANPVAAIENYDFQQRTDRFIGNIRLVASPFENFEVEYILGYDGSTSRATGFIPVGILPKNTGWSKIAEKTSLLLNNDLNLRYSFDLSEGINSISSVGFTQQYDATTLFSITADRLAPGILSTVGGSVIARSDVRSKRSIRGGFFQQTFGIADKIFVTGAIRMDQASTFGANERTQFYPKASASYVLSDEGFWQSGLGSVLNTFKLRASYGEAGNLTALSAFERLTNYNPVPIGGQTGFAPDSRAGNPDIKPERQREVEIGFDASTLNGKVGIEFTYYNVHVEDLLLSRVLAPTTGFSRRLENVGTMTNIGIEVMLRAQMAKTQNFSWELTTIYSRNRNEINDIEGGQLVMPDVFDQAVVAKNGEPIGVFSGTYFVRDENGQITTDNNDLPITSSDKKIIGDPNPDWTGSLINELTYKNWSFRMQFDAVMGFDVFNWTDRLNSHTDLFGGGRRDAQEIRGELTRGYNSATFQTFERYIEDGSFVKLRELSLAYRANINSKAIDNITISLTGRNLFSIDSYSGWDPEVSSFGQRNGVRGMDFNEVPIPRTFELGANISF